MLASNTILQGRYRIVRQLGQGGMGTVYEAIDERLSCVVALKETFAASDSEVGRAFEREAVLLANLRHPLLPKVMDHFTEANGQFLVMEFIHGNDLAELLNARDTPFALAQVLGWADELLKVLEYLHGRQPPILHRDIKPANLKLTKQGEIFVLDFGLAKGAAGQMPTLLTSRSVHGYTPVYASLEQIHGKGTDPRSDLYSLGATLYHLLTGTKPTDAPSRFTEMEDDRPDPLRRIDDINRQVSPAIAAVIHQAMAVSRKHRYATATAMRTALRNAELESRDGPPTRSPTNIELEKHRADEAGRMQVRAESERRAKEEQERWREEEERKRHRSEEERRNRDAQTSPSYREADPTQRSNELNTSKASPDFKTLRSQPPTPDTHGINSSGASTNSNKVGTNANAGIKRALLLTVAAVASVFGVLLIVVAGWMILRSTGTDTISDPYPTPTPARKSFRNNIGVDMVWITPGSFEMGSNNGQSDEKPMHRVTISRGFYMSKYEVTQGQWRTVMDNNPSTFKGDDNLPVEQVSWNDAQSFISILNDKSDEYEYRLPSEAEWEYACNGGVTSGYYEKNADDMAWYDNNSEKKTHSVGSKRPNAFGLYDMSGNVWEWCSDWYVGNYEGAPTDGTARLSGGEMKARVLRGASWSNPATMLRCSFRNSVPPEVHYSDLGFRLVAVVRNR